MNDKLNKSILFLTLDGSVWDRHEEKLKQFFCDIEPKEILNVLLRKEYNAKLNYQSVHSSIPYIFRNLKEMNMIESTNDNDYDDQKGMRNEEREGLPQFRNVSRILIENNVEHVYLSGPSFYKKAYPKSFLERMSSSVNILVDDHAIDTAYAQLINSLGFAPIYAEHDMRIFMRRYSSGFIPVTKGGFLCMMSHRLCSPRMSFCKINDYIQEVFARAVVDRCDDLPVKVLSPEDQILFCFAHMYYQQMYENIYNPQHYADIVGYMYNNEVDWMKVTNYCNRYDCNRILFYCILFLNEIHQYLFAENLFDQTLLDSIPPGMVRHLYECRNGTLFMDDIVGYHDSEPHELLLGFRHTTAAFGDLSSQYHSMKKEEKNKFLEKVEAHGILDYNYDTFGDISKLGSKI